MTYRGHFKWHLDPNLTWIRRVVWEQIKNTTLCSICSQPTHSLSLDIGSDIRKLHHPMVCMINNSSRAIRKQGEGCKLLFHWCHRKWIGYATSRKTFGSDYEVLQTSTKIFRAGFIGIDSCICCSSIQLHDAELHDPHPTSARLLVTVAFRVNCSHEWQCLHNVRPHALLL